MWMVEMPGFRSVMGVMGNKWCRIRRRAWWWCGIKRSSLVRGSLQWLRPRAKRLALRTRSCNYGRPTADPALPRPRLLARPRPHPPGNPPGCPRPRAKRSALRTRPGRAVRGSLDFRIRRRSSERLPENDPCRPGR